MSEPKPATKPRSRRSRSATRVLLLLTALVTVVFSGAVIALLVLISWPESADVAEGSFLHVKLKGDLSDAPPSASLFMDPSDFPPMPTEIAEGIRHAATDDRIAGIYLNLEMPNMGWGLTQEIRSALVEFRASEKPCVVYSEIYTTKLYYLASACDKVVAPPTGVTLISGVSGSVTYYRDGLEKLGIKPQFVHVGDYKTAIEPFERMEPSEAAKEANNLLFDGMYQHIVADIAASRGLSEEQVRALLDNPTIKPSRALESGLLDAIAYPDGVTEHVHSVNEDGWAEKLVDPVVEKEEDEDDKRFTSIKEYRKDIQAEHDGKSEKIAVIYGEGPILSGDGGDGLFGGGGIFYDKPFRKHMKEARKNDEVKAVVVRVNSGGGSMLASDMIWREVERTQAAGKPVVISMADAAASGGYMVSCGSDWIVAQPMTITGSIGVFMQSFNAAGTMEMLGMSEHTYKRGEHSDLLSLSKERSESAQTILQTSVNESYQTFVNQVAEGRSAEFDAIESVAQGRVWTGTQALERGLVDELGGLETAIAKAAELADIEDPGILRLPESKPFFEVLMEELDGGSQVKVELDVPLVAAEDLVRQVALLEAFQRDGGLIVYLPGNPTLK